MLGGGSDYVVNSLVEWDEQITLSHLTWSGSTTLHSRLSDSKSSKKSL